MIKSISPNTIRYTDDSTLMGTYHEVNHYHNNNSASNIVIVIVKITITIELIPIKIGFFVTFKVAQKSGQSPCTIVHGLGPNFIKNDKERILYFYNFFLYIYMYLRCVESLS